MKTAVSQLAAFGGPPSFDEPRHVGRPNIGDRAALHRRIDELLDRQWLTNDGPLVRELERRVCEYIGVGHAIAVCNATVGIEVLARALGLRGEVVVPAFSFVATAHAFAWLGLTPVFCDVEAESHTIDAAAMQSLVTRETAAVMGVHLWGGACDVAALRAAVNRPLLFDAAHAFGSSLNGQRIGTFGNAEVFSFHATKFFNTFEGGAITTNDDKLAAELRLLRNFGFSGYDRVTRVGTNAKMSEASAAMGLTSFDALADLMAVNQARFQQYRAHLSGLRGVRFVEPARADQGNHQYCVIEVGPSCGLTRDQLLQVLWQENVRARRYFYPGIHRCAPYDDEPTALPVTDRLVNEVLVLPTGAGVSQDDVNTICEIVHFALGHADEIAARLPAALAPGELTA